MDASKGSKVTKKSDNGMVKRKSCAYISHHTKYIQKINTGEDNNNRTLQEGLNEKFDGFSVANSDNEVIHVTNDGLVDCSEDHPFKGKLIGTILNPKHILRFDINNIPIKKGSPHYHHISFVDRLNDGLSRPIAEIIDIECHKKYHVTNNFTKPTQRKGNCCCSIF